MGGVCLFEHYSSHFGSMEDKWDDDQNVPLARPPTAFKLLSNTVYKHFQGKSNLK